MSTLTKYSAIPYTGPAPTNREPFVPTDAATHDARGGELAAQIENLEQERGQDLPTFIVDKNNKITYCEYVPEVGVHPNYDNALAALKAAVQ